MESEQSFANPNPDECRVWLMDEESLFHMDIHFPEDIHAGLKLGIKEYWQAFLMFSDQILDEVQVSAVEETNEL